MDRPATVRTYLDFEKPIAELESKVAESGRAQQRRGRLDLHHRGGDQAAAEGAAGAGRHLRQAHPLAEDAGGAPPRPPALPRLRRALIEDFTPLAGDRYFAEDAAIMGGLGRFRDRPVVVDRPREGLRRPRAASAQLRHGAARGLSQGGPADGPGRQVRPARDHAGRHGRRLPGIGAEERGQAEAIARSTDRCLSLGVPLVTVVIGEGGSGGAVAIARAPTAC